MNRPRIADARQNVLADFARLLALAILLTTSAGCARPHTPALVPDFEIIGFASRESVGDTPLFDLRAARAQVFLLENAVSVGTQLGLETSVMSIHHVNLTLFRGGMRSGDVAGETGMFYPSTKVVELHGGVTYNAVDDSFHVEASSMEWQPGSALLVCKDDVTGNYRQFQFTADRIDISRARGVFRLWNAEFIGPG